MKFHANLPLAVLATCTLVPAVYGQSSSPEQNIEILTVTGTRLPFDLSQLATSSTVLTSDEIRRSGARQISELLRSLPGVSIAESGSPGGLTEIRMRGSESNHLLVLIDGVIANDIGQGSLVDLAHLSTAGIARIELLRGPQSATWGSGAIGGVLNITTQAATSGSNQHSLKLAGGNRNTYEVGASTSARHDQVSYNLFADWLTTEGDNIARSGDEDDGYRNITTGAGLTWQASEQHTLSSSVRLVDYRNDYDGTDFISTGLPADADNITDGRQLSAQLSWRTAPTNTNYSSQLKWQYREDKNDNLTEGLDAGGTTGRRHQFTWENRYQFSGWQLAGGLEYLRREFEQRGPVDYGDPNQQQHDTTVSAFSEIGKSLTPDILATLSARYDDNSEFDDAVSYRLGLSWDLTPDHQLFASVGEAIKTPTFSERFGYYPESFIGNPDLQPESSQEWELGLRSQWGSALSGQVSVFSAQLENEILGFVYDIEANGYTAQNAASDSSRDGVETELNYQASLVSVRASYTYLDASQDDSDVALTELRRARHQAALTVSGDLPDSDWSGYVKLAYTGSRLDTYYPPYPLPAETVGLRPYTLVSLNVAYAVTAQWQLALRIDNALDADYEDIVGYQGEQRRALLTLSYQQ